jgi:predicted DNA-binding transcriptional regulator AlpA
MTPDFIDAGAVSARLGIGRALFLRHRAQLEDQHGFPLPMPLPRTPMKWRADAVDLWISQHGLPAGSSAAAPSAAPRPVGNVVMMAEAARP